LDCSALVVWLLWLGRDALPARFHSDLVLLGYCCLLLVLFDAEVRS
jgi:hypothetical protein